jgi:hypothetical protein
MTFLAFLSLAYSLCKFSTAAGCAALAADCALAETQELVELLDVTRSRINCAVVKTGRQAPGRVTRAQAAQVIADKKAARELAVKAKLAMSMAAQSRQDQKEED